MASRRMKPAHEAAVGVGKRAGYYNNVVLRTFRVERVGILVHHIHRVEPVGGGEYCARATGQFLVVFEAAHAPAERSQAGCEIAAAGTDFQHPLAACYLYGL